MSTATADLVVRIVTDTKKASSGFSDATTKFGKFKSGLHTAAIASTAVLGGLTAAAISFGNAAADDEKSQALLANTMRNSAGAGKQQIANMEDWIDKASRASGVADDELRPAMQNLVRATGDATAAQKDMKVAMNISAATGKPLETVTKAIAKGYSGSTTALGKLVPGLDKATLASGNFHKILNAAADATKGAMAQSADTAAGRMARMQVSINEAKESLGAGLLPIMAKFAGIIQKVGELVAKHSTTFQILAGIIAAVAAAIILLNAAISVYTTVTTAAAIASEAAWISAIWPILAIVAAVVAVIAIFVILYKKVKWFRDAVNAAFRFIKSAISTAIDFVKNHWQTALIIMGGPIAILIALVVKNFDKIKAGIRVVASVLKSVWRAAIGVVKTIWRGLKSAITTIFNGIKAIFRGAVSVFKTVWRLAMSVVKGYFRAWKLVLTTIFSAIKTAVRTAANVFKDIWRGAVATAKEIWRGFKTFFTGLWNGIAQPVRNAFSNVKAAITGVIQWIKDKWKPLEDILTAPFDAVVTVIDKIKDAVQWIIDKIGDIKIPDLPGPLGGLTPWSAPAPESVVAVPNGRGIGLPVPVIGARAGATSGGVNITVNGAIDPENTARQIRRILAGHERRVGLRAS